MRSYLHKAYRLLVEDEGPTATEYAVMLAAIVLVCIAAIMLIGNKVSQTYQTVESGLPDGS